MCVGVCGFTEWFGCACRYCDLTGWLSGVLVYRVVVPCCGSVTYLFPAIFAFEGGILVDV